MRGHEGIDEFVEALELAVANGCLPEMRAAYINLADLLHQRGRSDDKADVIRHRLRVYAETTGPLVPYYEERGILIAVDADQPPESVTASIQARLSGLSLPGLSPGGAS